MDAAPHPKRARGSMLGLLVVGLAAAGVLAGTQPEKSYGDTLFSRLATIYSLTEYGSWAIADPALKPNPFEPRTVDKVEIDGRIYSSKPPLLPILMLSELAALSPFFGWMIENPDDLHRATWILTVTWSGIPFVLMVWWLWLSARMLIPQSAAAQAFIALAAAGTQAAAYATVFNNHVIAASSVVACFYFALRLRVRAHWADFAAFGLAAGFAATMDIPTAIYPALLGLWLAPARLRGLLMIAVPVAAIPLGVQMAALIAATGSPLPVQMHGDWYLYESSYWRNPGGIDAMADPKGWYLFHITIGRVGLFSLFPVTLLGAVGLVVALRGDDARAKGLVVVGAVASAILMLYYAWTTNNYGGEAWGFRWSIAVAPVLLLMAIPVVGRMRRPWQWGIAALLLTVSIVSAAECVRHPWQTNTEWTTRIFGPAL